MFRKVLMVLGVDDVPGTGQIVFSISNGIDGEGLNVAGVAVALQPQDGDGSFFVGKVGLTDFKLHFR